MYVYVVISTYKISYIYVHFAHIMHNAHVCIHAYTIRLQAFKFTFLVNTY